MADKSTGPIRNIETAEKIYILLKDKLPHPWTDIDPFNLKEAMTKPLVDFDALNTKFEEGKLPLNPIFPFSIINKYLQKLKADSDNKQKHIDSYIFASKVDDDKQEDLSKLKIDLEGDLCRNYIINKTKRRTKLFFECLVALSKEGTFYFNTYPSEQQIIKKTRLFLIGSPGTGKTTFLNYLLSVYAPDIGVSQNTMVIRIDLNDAINKKTNFKKLIEAKFYDVFRNYFFAKDIFTFDFNKLRSYIAERRKLNLKNKSDINLKSIDRAINDFRKGNSNLERIFLSELMHFLNDELKISFIFFVDGLDYITLDEI